MITLLTSLFGASLTKYIGYFFAIVTLLAALGIGYAVWKKSIENAATLQFNNAQLQQTIKDQQLYISNMQSLDAVQKDAINQLTNTNNQLSDQLNNISNSITADPSGKAASSKILKNTIKQLESIK